MGIGIFLLLRRPLKNQKVSCYLSRNNGCLARQQVAQMKTKSTNSVKDVLWSRSGPQQISHFVILFITARTPGNQR
ncbi:hypothetical protein DTO271D3_1926 [Paecilomyces variotii]|nr:hypothetical protein DTO271D3_1926 [Paecilomyces variotii]